MPSQWQIDFWTSRLAAKLALLEKYDIAMTALAGGVTSYTINTGQTTQTVTRSSVNMIRTAMGALEAEIEELQDKLNGTDSNSVYVRPDY